MSDLKNNEATTKTTTSAHMNQAQDHTAYPALVADKIRGLLELLCEDESNEFEPDLLDLTKGSLVAFLKHLEDKMQGQVAAAARPQELEMVEDDFAPSSNLLVPPVPRLKNPSRSSSSSSGQMRQLKIMDLMMTKKTQPKAQTIQPAPATPTTATSTDSAAIAQSELEGIAPVPATSNPEKFNTILTYYDCYKVQVKNFGQLMEFISLSDSRYPSIVATQLREMIIRIESQKVQYSGALEQHSWLSDCLQGLVEQSNKFLGAILQFELSGIQTNVGVPPVVAPAGISYGPSAPSSNLIWNLTPTNSLKTGASLNSTPVTSLSNSEITPIKNSTASNSNTHQIDSNASAPTNPTATESPSTTISGPSTIPDTNTKPKKRTVRQPRTSKAKNPSDPQLTIEADSTKEPSDLNDDSTQPDPTVASSNTETNTSQSTQNSIEELIQATQNEVMTEVKKKGRKKKSETMKPAVEKAQKAPRKTKPKAESKTKTKEQEPKAELQTDPNEEPKPESQADPKENTTQIPTQLQPQSDQATSTKPDFNFDPDHDIWNDLTGREVFYAVDDELDEDWQPAKRGAARPARPRPRPRPKVIASTADTKKRLDTKALDKILAGVELAVPREKTPEKEREEEQVIDIPLDSLFSPSVSPRPRPTRSVNVNEIEVEIENETENGDELLIEIEKGGEKEEEPRNEPDAEYPEIDLSDDVEVLHEERIAPAPSLKKKRRSLERQPSKTAIRPKLPVKRESSEAAFHIRMTDLDFSEDFLPAAVANRLASRTSSDTLTRSNSGSKNLFKRQRLGLGQSVEIDDDDLMFVKNEELAKSDTIPDFAVSREKRNSLGYGGGQTSNKAKQKTIPELLRESRALADRRKSNGT